MRVCCTLQVYLKKEDLSLDAIAQYNVRCPGDGDKMTLLKERVLPIADNLGQTIIFVRSRVTCRELHNKLEKDGYKCTSVAGGQSLALLCWDLGVWCTQGRRVCILLVLPYGVLKE
jgi:superfamily II DNA/RNA helicase